jgi:hypothetical protein
MMHPNKTRCAGCPIVGGDNSEKELQKVTAVCMYFCDAPDLM